MPLTAFDHVNVRTTNLAEMQAWYTDILGLAAGPRPEFPFPGAWMYLGDRAVVHLVEVSGTPQAGGEITLEHFAFRATDIDAFTGLLSERGIPHHLAVVPGIGITQVNLHDPDGNHIHVDFQTGSAPG